ncbi:MAG: L-fuculose-phosphate aldolase [Desulfobulbaceae bacterium]|nr:MAG: L-fuculose-phosphate aldolase [Desulfobulbaceae bacterium]
MSLLLANEREQIVTFGRKLLEQGLTRGTSGNLSIFNRRERLMAISPSGLDYLLTSAEDVVVTDLEGRIVDGARNPSSERALHTIIYQNRDDLSAVVHTHSSFSTVLSCLGWELPAIHYMIALSGPTVRCAEYATFGSQQLAVNALAAMRDRNAVLLANHGLLTAGCNLASAFHITTEIEFCAEIYWRCRSVGQPVLLDQAEMSLMKEKFRTYGQIISDTEI